MLRNVLINAGLVALSVMGGAIEVSAQEQGSAVKGRQAYLAAGCMYCHGRSGQGGALNGPAPPLAKTALPIEGFRMVLRESLRDMPAYSEAVLADQQILDIYAFVQSLPGRRSHKDIAILND